MTVCGVRVQAHQRKYLKECANTVKRVSPNLQLCLVIQMRTIGSSSPEILKEHRQLFEELKQQAALKDYCQAALDVIEGRRYSLTVTVIQLQAIEGEEPSVRNTV